MSVDSLRGFSCLLCNSAARLWKLRLTCAGGSKTETGETGLSSSNGPHGLHSRKQKQNESESGESHDKKF